MSIKQYNYSKFAEYYDIIELGKNDVSFMNNFLDKIFKKYKIKTVLDITCGTGAQAIGLSKKGYKLTASDINKEMLKIAIKKAKNLNIKFHQGDIRTSKYGKFDAVIAIFNAIGHLNKKDFEKAIRNVSQNLKESGLFIFDIFNFDFMKNNFMNYKFIDVVREHKGTKFCRFNHNKLDSKNSIMKINQETWVQKDSEKPQIIKEKWDMQIYSSDELKKLLERNGFKVKEVYGGANKKFIENKSLFIFVVAKKIALYFSKNKTLNTKKSR